MKHVYTAAALFLAASAALAGTAQDTWNLASDFSISNGNPNGAWTYGWFTNDFTQFTPMTPYTNAADASTGWTGNLGGDRTPAVWHNTGGAGNPHGIPLNWVSLHPAPGGEGAVARWTCPAGVSGGASITGEFLAGDSGAMQVAVRVNGVEEFHAINSGAFAICRAIQPGTVVDFIVYGGYAYGNTPLRATISTHRCNADLGAAGGTASLCGDGMLDNNDFIVFINYFFEQNALADRGQSGGEEGSDGLFDNNDFIAFINQFFEGC